MQLLYCCIICPSFKGNNDIGYNNPEVDTPNLDNLANNGVILESNYVYPVCSPYVNNNHHHHHHRTPKTTKLNVGLLFKALPWLSFSLSCKNIPRMLIFKIYVHNCILSMNSYGFSLQGPELHSWQEDTHIKLDFRWVEIF